MFARLRICKYAKKLVIYNERKVLKGQARLIHAENFLQKTEDLTQLQKLGRFRSLNDLNQWSKVNMVSVVLSFSETDHMRDDKMRAIANRYMEHMGLQDQPYLVYRHEDTSHPHLHIVSNIVDPTGQAIRIYKTVMDRKYQVREQLMAEFGLKSVQRTEKQQVNEIERPRKLRYGKMDTTQGMERVLKTVVSEYHFTGIEEFNAILGGYNMYVRPVASAKKYFRNGLVYQTLDADGRSIGKTIAASYFENKPTWNHLQRRFVENAMQDEDRTKDLANRLKWVLYQKPEDLADFSRKLSKERIGMVVIPGAGDARNELVYVDHEAKLAIQSRRLGESVQAPWVREKIDKLIQSQTGLAAIPQQIDHLLAKDQTQDLAARQHELNIKSQHKIRLHV